MADRNTGLVKRQQIAKATRSMFIAIAIASVIVGASAVSSVFMVRKLIFNNKILAAKNSTVRILEQNNKVVDELRGNVRKLNADPLLQTTPPRLNSEEQPIRVILDALPDRSNEAALGASLQQVLLAMPGISVQSLSVGATAGSEAAATPAATPTTPGATTTALPSTIPISFKISADSVANASELLRRLERSIRAINITACDVEKAGQAVTLSVTAEAYYQPAVGLELTDSQVKP